jgi:hypothetical protein
LAATVAAAPLLGGAAASSHFAPVMRDSAQAQMAANSVVTSGPSAPAGTYAFEVVNAYGQPIRWNPCELIRFAVVSAGAPAGWLHDVVYAVDSMVQKTGIGVHSLGIFPSVASLPRSAQLVIEWSRSLNAGDRVGLTTYWYYNDPGYTPQIVMAHIQILSTLRAGGGSGELPVMLHELGHAMGLAHTPNMPEAMSPVDRGYSAYQSGDVAGLYRLGRAPGCRGFYS